LVFLAVLYLSVGYKYGIKEISSTIRIDDAGFEKTGFRIGEKLIQIISIIDFLDIFVETEIQ